MSLENIGHTITNVQTFLVDADYVVNGVYQGKDIGLCASNGISSVRDKNGEYASVKSGQKVTICCRPIIPFQFDSDDSPQKKKVRIHVVVKITKIREVDCSCKECGWAFEINPEPPECECDPEEVWDEGKQPCVIM